MNQTTGDIAARLGGALIGDPAAPIHGAGTLQDGQPGEIGFLSEPHYRKYLADTALTAVLLAEPCPESRATQIIVADVKRAWRELAASFAPPLPPPAISPQAHIDPTATIGTNVAIGAGAVIGAGADIGDGCRIEPLAYIAPGVRIGADSHIGAGARLLAGTTTGARVQILANAVIGERGFGNNFENGRWLPVTQLGGVRIGDDVEIGACTTIDRGAVRDTIIGNGVKLDNHIQIGHNVVIGDHTVIAGSAVIAGSVTFGKYCVVGGACVFTGHITICDGAQFTGHSSISKSVTEPGAYSSGIPAMPARQWKKFFATLKLLAKEKP
ncbi:UDP-3-O-[3-hydroxymyristoyl] glucosamine N-acyltransferase [Cardiobacterium hominis]|uniref:UDP-3-O-acylglucosamine N-acyltransferase n=1 Tax=Cardiobacterium hominis TaxID=2718 RepID=A0A1C3H296_9GAMM|nr:UDP-3-O-(3-hydroxymyristoyl)glucosamine N-acyltransferase [Cardiobacterium hominis]SAM57840.1 UDP-3-O-[3-hydroxymyristoyl] glucosamine N-acyltransferase [Cardiobacterium hominis]